MEKTLLEKAKSLPKKQVKRIGINDQEYELGIAFIKGEITLRDIHEVMGFRNVNSVYTLLIHSFKRYYSETNGE